MNQKELYEILEKHRLWLRGKPGGVQANLRGARLYALDLHEADLREADLRETNLYRANLREANLEGANLHRADLSEADLRGANLCEANLQRANLRKAILKNAYLWGTNLYGADLSEADIQGADLCRANLRRAINVPFIPMACPDTGSFVAWKKAFSISEDPYLVKLLIPEDARRSSATGRKCRADKAKVLAIEPIVAVPVIADKVYSKYDPYFYYQVGQHITVPDFDTDRFIECAPGIHFFINRQEAIDYYA